MKLLSEDIRCEYKVLTEAINGKPHLTIRGCLPWRIDPL
jgi:hypothetical protein